jgi:hypothetical protein
MNKLVVSDSEYENIRDNFYTKVEKSKQIYKHILIALNQ